jgi:hypothetical protein
MVHDLDLVQNFLRESLQRRHLLLFSPFLKAHHICGVNQLIGLQQGIVATVDINQDQLTVLVNPDSSYRDILHHILAGERFLRRADTSVASTLFWQYQQIRPPKGYQFYCTTPNILWIAWWRHYHHQRNALLSDLLVWVRQQWYPVRDLVIKKGQIHIKSLAQEIVLSSQESIVWLEKMQPQSQQKQSYQTV